MPQAELIIFVSAGVKDLRLVLTEIHSVNLPVINLTNYLITPALYTFNAFPNRNHVYFYLQYLYYLVNNYQKKNILNQIESSGEKNTNFTYFNENVHCFQKIKEKKNMLFQLPVWFEK